jgi:hypothetical protein
VLLPSDTYSKPITSITAVLLPFVTYLLNLSRIIYNDLHNKLQQYVMLNAGLLLLLPDIISIKKSGKV